MLALYLIEIITKANRDYFFIYMIITKGNSALRKSQELF